MGLKDKFWGRLYGIFDRLMEHANEQLEVLNIRDTKAVVRDIVKSELEKHRENVFRDMSYALTTARTHEKTFLPFHRKHEGKDFVIVASGPSGEKYKSPIEGAVHIAVNRSYQLSHIKFDYLFIQDISGARKYVEGIADYRKGECVKFYGITGIERDNVNLIMSDDHLRKAGALRYYSALRNAVPDEVRFPYDLSTQPLGDYGSIALPAIQFALWAGAKRIYLVGCDNSQNGYAFGGEEQNSLALDLTTRGFVGIKEFAARYYPEAEIVSINPVGLKGLFIDEER